MFDPENKGEKARRGSLLSLGGSAPAERTPVSGPRQAANDATTRHKLARSRREARPGTLMNALGSAPPPKSPDAAARHQAARDAKVVEREVEQAATRAQSAVSEPALPPVQEPRVEVAQPAPPRPAPQMAAPRPAAPSQPTASPEPVAEAAWQQPEYFAAQDDRWQPLIDPVMIIDRVWNSKKLIASTTLAGALLGVMVALSTPKMYSSLSEIEFNPAGLKVLDRDISRPDSLQNEMAQAVLENQSRIITSEPVLKQVVIDRGLQSEAEFNGQGDSGIGSLLNPVAFLRSLLARSDSPSPEALIKQTAENLREHVSVSRTGKSFILNVIVEAENPTNSANINKSLVNAYLKTNSQFQTATAIKASGELTGRLKELRESVEAAEDKVAAFKAENDIIDPQGRSIADDELLKLNEQLSNARARTLELDARAKSARQLNVNSVVEGAIPEGAASGVLTEMRAQYAAAKQSLDNASVRLGPRHPQRQALEAQLAGARDQISAELRRIVSSVQIDLKRGVELEQDLAARLAQQKVRHGDTSQHMVQLRELERDLTTKRQVYESFMLRARETGEQQNLNTSNIKIISEATPPLEASGPSRTMIAGTGTMLGLLAGLGIASALGVSDSLRASAASSGRRRQRNANGSGDRPGGGSGTFNDADNGDEADMYYNYPPYQPQPYAAPAQPVHGYAPPQPVYPQPQPVPAPVQAYAHPQPVYAPQPMPQQPPMQQPAYHQAGYAPAPVFAPAPPPAPVYAQQPQMWPQPAPQPQAWPQPQSAPQPVYAAPQPVYAPPAPPVYPQPAAYAPAPQYPAQGPAEMALSVSNSIDDIRATVRECRDAVRHIATSQSRRYF